MAQYDSSPILLGYAFSSFLMLLLLSEVNAFRNTWASKNFPFRTKCFTYGMSTFEDEVEVKGILFDMDGTLTDSDKYHYECYRDVILEFAPSFNDGEPISRAFYNKELSGQSNPVIVPKLFPEMPPEQQRALWEEKEQRYRDVSVGMEPLEGLKNFLSRCDEKGIQMIIVTNSPRPEATHTLQALGLMERFESTIVIGMECEAVKPDPAPYFEGLKRLGLTADECLAFEDSIGGCKSACTAGLQTIGVCTTWSVEEMKHFGCQTGINNFHDVTLWNMLFQESPPLVQNSKIFLQ